MLTTSTSRAQSYTESLGMSRDSDAPPGPTPRLVNIRDLRIVSDVEEGEAVSLLLIRAVLTASRERGVAAQFPELEGIDLDLSRDPAIGVPRDQATAFIGRIATVTGDPHFGLDLGQSMTEAHYNFAGPLLSTQTQASRAIDLFLQLRRSILGGPSWRAEEVDGEVRVGHALRRDDLGHRAEAALGISVAYHAAIRFWGAWAAPSLRVEFTFPAEGAEARYRAMFGGRVTFDAPLNALYFPVELLHYTRPAADAELAARLSAYAYERYLPVPGDQSWEHRVRSVLVNAKSLAGLELPGVAKQCKVSPRTLRRRLAAESTSFSAVREHVRLERAAELLATGRDSVDTIAKLLGYTEVNSFRRVFKKWSGRTPTTYREEHGSGVTG
jgi:AraC-like DNA-binding protein